MERLRPIIDKLSSVFYEPLAPELRDFRAKVIKGEMPELLVDGKTTRIFDRYGDTLRIRIPWGEDGLEKSYLARVDKETGKVTCELRGFFYSDKHDWPK